MEYCSFSVTFPEDERVGRFCVCAYLMISPMLGLTGSVLYNALYLPSEVLSITGLDYNHAKPMAPLFIQRITTVLAWHVNDLGSVVASLFVRINLKAPTKA